MIIATSTIRHDGNVYTEGQEIPGLTTEQAAQLVSAGAATEHEPTDTRKTSGGAKG